MNFDNEVLKQVCYKILTASDEEIRTTQVELAKIPKEKYGKQAYIVDLLPRLQEQYSKEDPGNLVALLYGLETDEWTWRSADGSIGQ